MTPSRLVATAATAVIATTALAPLAPATASPPNPVGSITLKDKARDFNTKGVDKQQIATSDIRSVKVARKKNGTLQVDWKFTAFPKSRKYTLKPYGTQAILDRALNLDLVWKEGAGLGVIRLGYLEEPYYRSKGLPKHVIVDAGRQQGVCKKSSIKVNPKKALVTMKMPASCIKLPGGKFPRKVSVQPASIVEVGYNISTAPTVKVIDEAWSKKFWKLE